MEDGKMLSSDGWVTNIWKAEDQVIIQLNSVQNHSDT